MPAGKAGAVGARDLLSSQPAENKGGVGLGGAVPGAVGGTSPSYG